MSAKLKPIVNSLTPAHIRAKQRCRFCKATGTAITPILHEWWCRTYDATAPEPKA